MVLFTISIGGLAPIFLEIMFVKSIVSGSLQEVGLGMSGGVDIHVSGDMHGRLGMGERLDMDGGKILTWAGVQRKSGVVLGSSKFSVRVNQIHGIP